MSWHGPETSAEMSMAGDATVAASLFTRRSEIALGGGLGAAVAGGGRWVIPLPQSETASPQPYTTPERQRDQPAHQLVRVPRDVLRMMAEAAWATGRGEDEIWIEAAREWLRRRMRDDEPPPTAPASAWPSAPRATRTWAAIDALVAELRPSA